VKEIKSDSEFAADLVLINECKQEAKLKMIKKDSAYS